MKTKSFTAIVSLYVALVGLCYASAETPSAQIANSVLTVSVRNGGAVYELQERSLQKPVLTSRIGAEVDHQWLWSTDYPHANVATSTFSDQLGPAHRLQVTFSGNGSKPELRYTVDLYDQLSFGAIQVQLRNSGSAPVQIQVIRVLDATGTPVVNLGAAENDERVLSDSFSEDRPPLHIFDLGKAREYMGEDSYSDNLTPVHFAVGSQLIYNRASQYSLLLAAFTSERWLTLYHLTTDAGAAGPHTTAFAVDSTGTTEVLKKESLHTSPAEQQMELSVSLKPGETISSEKVMLSVGKDYHAQLEAYGAAIRVLHNARISKPAPWGWWSWTAYYYGLSEGPAVTNAEWLAQNLKKLGFDIFHLDENWAYADSEYVSPNAALFPNGIRSVTYKATSMGLRLGLWVAPFRVSQRAWVYQDHRDWLVHDEQGTPIQIGYVSGKSDPLYVLDTTHPDAQAYLRSTFQKLAREWGVRYFKMDFMDDTAIEGFHYRPNTSAIEALQIGLKIIRDAVGDDILLDKDGSPMLAPVGYTDLGRTSTDTGHSFHGAKEDATGIAARYYMNRNFYGADPDAFSISEQLITDHPWHSQKVPLSLDEAEVSITLAAIAGGMFEIGDDLPTLGADPARLALVENPDLLNMLRLQRAAVPLDLMTYLGEDEQPSIFLLREDHRQSMLAVFNWTDGPRTHDLDLQQLGVVANGRLEAVDVFRHDRSVNLAGGRLQIVEQAPHSVRLIKLVDSSVPASPPLVQADIPTKGQIGESVEFKATVAPDSVPALRYVWEFGDGTRDEGAVVHHAYTRNGNYNVRLVVDGLDGKPTIKSGTFSAQGTIKTTFEVQNNRRYQEH
ncbi:MAG TPA: PKD domain-containing protein [Terriglobales bacterium]|nr:PKD domain-containing protein [Terriglobales bacterium]